MEANMSYLKRRLNRAMVECRSQASFTARRLVGQIRTMETVATTTRFNHRSRGQSATAATLVASPSTMISSKHLQRRHNNHHFSYTFSPRSSSSSSSSMEQATQENDEHYLEEVEFEDQAEDNGNGSDEDGNCNVSVGAESGQIDDGQDHGRRQRQQKHRICHPHHQQPSLGRHYLTEGQDCCLANFESQDSKNLRKSINNNITTTTLQDDIDEQQQVEEFSSEENDITSSSSSINNNQVKNKMWKMSRKNKSKKLQACQLTSKLSPISLKSASKLSSPLQQQHQHQHFIRCSAISAGFKTRSSVRRSKRDSKRNQRRQVRFEPTPQSIDISATTIESEENSFKLTSQTTSNDSNEENEISSTSENDSIPTIASVGGKQVVVEEERQQQAIRFENRERKKIPQYLSATKPFTKKLHHLSHNIKFNKIKLKSFNNLAHQIHQTLSNSTNNFVPDHHQNSSSTINKLRKVNKQQSSSLKQASSSSSYCISSSQTTTAATSSRYLTSEQTNGDDEDFGWGSDFDEHESVDSSLTSQQQQQDFKDQPNDKGRGGIGMGTGTSGGYLLEIGKSSCDFRAIEDVIQDQGTSGQFKRLDLSHHENPFERTRSPPARLDKFIGDEDETNHSSGVCRDEDKLSKREEEEEAAGDEIEDDEEDDEAELRSLEARQGFKQIRDKLKIILDQRLANYEKSAVVQKTGVEVELDTAKITSTSTNSKRVTNDNKNAISRSENKLMVINEDINNSSSVNTTTLSVNIKTSPSSSSEPSNVVNNNLKIDAPSISDITTSIKTSPSTTTTDSASISPPSTSSSTTTTLTSSLTTKTAAITVGSSPTNSTTLSTTTANLTTPPSHNGCTEFEDCQSHCSDESSSSSVGLDSNHSSGQDSGHSTQHSGYSTSSSVMHRHHHGCHDNHHHNNHHHNHHHQVVCSANDRRTGAESSPIQPGTLSVSPPCDTRNDKSSPVASTPPLSSSAYSSSSSPSQMIMRDGDTDMGLPNQATQLKLAENKANLLDSSDETREERRNRFLQNRLIINGKLESMFKSRSSGNLSSASLSPPKHSSPKVDKQDQASDRKQQQHQVKLFQQQQQQQQLDRGTLATVKLPNASDVIDSQTRVKLLEQQRQISLKLKQKPRRKSAKRAFMVNSQSLDSNTEEDSGSYASSNPSERLSSISSNNNNQHQNHHQYNKVVIPTTCIGTIRHNNYESLTKQLSMICLRQAGSQLAVFQTSQKPLDKHHLGTSSYATSGNWNEAGKDSTTTTTTGNSSRNVESNFNMLKFSNQQQQPKAALSLRQLVKDVIDDCEKPNKLSSLTISILNRSDSLSSDLGNISADEAGMITPSPQQQQIVTASDDINHIDNRLEEGENQSNQSFNDDSVSNHQARRSNFYQNHRYQNHIYASPTSSLSLSSLPAAAAAAASSAVTTTLGVRSSSPIANQAHTEGNKCCSTTNRAIAVEPIGYMIHPIPLPTISMKSTSNHYNQHSCNQHYLHQHYNNQQQQQQQQVATADQSISSIGSIDGLEYSRATTSSGYSNSELCLQAHNVDETAGVISSGLLANTNATVGFAKMQKSTIGSYLKSLRELSRFKKLPKVKLITNGNGNINNNNKQTPLNHQQLDRSCEQVATVTPFANKTITSTVGHHNKLPPSSYCEFYNDVNFY